jgi:FKBP-type peptidyl-prolyl cis-trans isomerase FklB
MTTMNWHMGRLVIAPLLAVLILSAACRKAKPHEAPASTPIGDIQLSYKRDPRVTDPYRGLGPWVTGPSYTSAAAQEAVETKARVVDAKGAPVKATPEWIASDPEMVTVSPTRGDQVTIAVHRTGESQLRLNAGRFSKELTIRAKYEGQFMVFEISPSVSANTSGTDTAEMNPALKSTREQVSYALGMDLAKTLKKQSVDVDVDLLRQGFVDALSGNPTMMSENQARAMLTGVVTEINLTDAGLERKQLAERNRRDSEEFLTKNRAADGVVTLASGLQYKVLDSGNGKKPTFEDVAVCHYRGMFLDGSEFDNSRNKKTSSPVSFPVKGVIKGWQEALQLMPAGAKWQLFVPPDLAYGERGAPRSKIGPNMTLMFEVELLSVEPAGAPRHRAKAKYEQAEISPEVLDRLKRVAQGQTKTETTPNGQEVHP